MLNKFFFQLATPELPICGVVDSPTQRLESATLHINDTRSGRLPDSMIRGVDNSPYQWYAGSTTLRITDTASFLLKNSIADSPYRWCGEWSLTPRIVESESHGLRVLLIRRVVFQIRENSKPKSERLEIWCKGPMPNRLMQKPREIRFVSMSL